MTPAKTGWHFSPASWPYSNIVADQTNQEYTGYQPTISGYVTDGAGAGMAGVSVSADGGGSAVTDDAGYYEIVVPYDWSGTVTPAKAAWGFDPAARIYSNVVTDQTNQNYTAWRHRHYGRKRPLRDYGSVQLVGNGPVLLRRLGIQPAQPGLQ
ncbi:MAG: carboxypeptidase-like regulatory domain-containing protein [Planctomycetota bacterium]